MQPTRGLDVKSVSCGSHARSGNSAAAGQTTGCRTQARRNSKYMQPAAKTRASSHDNECELNILSHQTQLDYASQHLQALDSTINPTEALQVRPDISINAPCCLQHFPVICNTHTSCRSHSCPWQLRLRL